MKAINEYLITEVSASSFVNKIKKDIEKTFGNKVTMTSAKANYTQLYDIYVYDDSLDTLKKINDLLKKYLTIWKGFTEEELKKKLEDHKEWLKKYKSPWKDSPIEFFRFTSRDVRKIIEG